MASIKELKKDIDFLASELISECYFRMMMIENADNSALAATVSKALNFRNEFINRANHPDGKENAKVVKAYYRKGYATDVETIGIENNVMEFHTGKTVESCRYDYSGYKILTYESGKKGVRYLFECKNATSHAPKFVQFSDHTIGPKQSAHFHIFMGNTSHEALLKEMDNWPTYYPNEMYKDQVVEEMLHH